LKINAITSYIRENEFQNSLYFSQLTTTRYIFINPSLQNNGTAFQICGEVVFLLSMSSIKSLQLLEFIGSEINSVVYIREVHNSIPDLNRNILISRLWLSSFFAMNGVGLATRGSRCHW
jgi:hypothetical protein